MGREGLPNGHRLTKLLTLLIIVQKNTLCKSCSSSLGTMIRAYKRVSRTVEKFGFTCPTRSISVNRSAFRASGMWAARRLRMSAISSHIYNWDINIWLLKAKSGLQSLEPQPSNTQLDPHQTDGHFALFWIWSNWSSGTICVCKLCTWYSKMWSLHMSLLVDPLAIC